MTLASAAPGATEPRHGGEPNCGFEKIELLKGDVGYLKVSELADPRACGQAAHAAMERMSGARAMIFDLTECGGGHAGMVALLATYLFRESVELSGQWDPVGNFTRKSWTLDYVAGARLSDARVYVLTSQQTFSAAEQFAYDLKNLGRATIVGRTSGGGAHPTQPVQVDPRFTLNLPWARSVSPVTQSNWEGVGVRPDIDVPVHKALEASLAAALAPAG
jgi:C-terminal processing protease CtpA/Prc